jgi:hypothetical protein
MRPSQVGTILELAVNARIPTMIWGAPGVGKSDVVRQTANKLKRTVRDIRISQLDAVDLRGIPTVEAQVTYWNPPCFLPDDKEPPGILFLDEINSGQQATMAAAYQLVLDRRLGDYVLPDSWAIVAAGNRLQDRAIVNAMPAPLRNRFIHIDFEVHLDDWCEWAIRNNVHADVLGFVRYRPTLLNELDAPAKDEVRKAQASQKLKDARAFGTPRSFSFLSRLLSVGIPSDIEYETYGSTVGEGIAAEFIAYRKYASKMPNLDAVLLNPSKAPIPEEPATLYATATGLATKATADNFDRIVQYTDRLPAEFGVMCVKDCMSRDESLSASKAFNAWALRNSDVIL